MIINTHCILTQDMIDAAIKARDDGNTGWTKTPITKCCPIWQAVHAVNPDLKFSCDFTTLRQNGDPIAYLPEPACHITGLKETEWESVTPMEFDLELKRYDIKPAV